MAEIYNGDGNELAAGLQSGTVCDEAIIAARGIAKDIGEEVFLEDDGDRCTVWPDGAIEEGWEGDWDDDKE